MSSFAPATVLTLHHFEVRENGRGSWVAKDKEGLIGGVFRTQKDALRFALFEAAGDSSCVKVIASPRLIGVGGRRPPRRAGFMAS
jgi:hypothetical protein